MRGRAAPAPRVRIRTYAPSDFPSVRRLWKQAGLHVGPSDTRKEIERARARDPDLFLVAERSGVLVGAVLGRFDGRRGWVNHLAVRAERRRAGIGRALMGELERRFARSGCPKVNLHVEPENEAVCAFYGRLGYRTRALIFMDKWLVPPAP